MIAIVWQFETRPGLEKEFERDQSRATRYLVVEYWSEMLVYEQHKMYRSDEVAKLHERRNELVESVEPLGVFTALDVPDRAGPTWSRRH